MRKVGQKGSCNSAVDGGIYFSLVKAKLFGGRLTTIYALFLLLAAFPSAPTTMISAFTSKGTFINYNFGRSRFYSVISKNLLDKQISSTASAKGFEIVFHDRLPDGLCLGIRVDQDSDVDSSHWLYNHLHPEEVRFGLDLSKRHNNIRPFHMGRLAMRQLFLSSQLGCYEHGPMLRDCYGRPILPKGVSGSISHKRNIAVAIISNESLLRKGDEGISSLQHVGVDIELITPNTNIGKRVLTQNERDNLGMIGLSETEEILLRFSLKESIYKAIHPVLNQYIGFQEAEVTPHENGTANAILNLKSGNQTQIEYITAHWEKILDNEYFLTSATATARNTR